MSQLNWESILLNYEHAYNTKGGETNMWMHVLVAALMQHPEIATLFPMVEENVLTIFIGKYYEHEHNPTITIELNHEIKAPLNSDHRYKFTYISTGKKDGELYRQNKEIIHCPWHKIREVFEQLFERLKKEAIRYEMNG